MKVCVNKKVKAGLVIQLQKLNPLLRPTMTPRSMNIRKLEVKPFLDFQNEKC